MIESASMYAHGTYSRVYQGLKARGCVLALVLAFLVMLAARVSLAQSEGSEEKHFTTIRGRVLNRVTKEPVARALVTRGNGYATVTDDRGQFEFKIVDPRKEEPMQGNVAGSRPTSISGTRELLQARKPGFLPPKPAFTGQGKEGQEEATIYLTPEALIVGRVTAAGAEAGGIQCELYVFTTTDSKQRWNPAGTFTAWANGEFRFSGLSRGTYRLITHELADRDSLALGRGAQMFGYPPVYYPNTTDFSAAAAIVVKAGETVQVNLGVTRREYYPVRIPVANPPASRGVNVLVYPMGHWGPGWSLGYNPQTQSIEGMLPNGNYTAELNTYGEERATGIVNFTVSGRAAQGPPMSLVPNATVSVTLREEFQTQPAGPGQHMVFINPAKDQENQPKAQVMLRPLDDFFAPGSTVNSQPVEGTQGKSLTIPNVRPGRYRVEVTAFMGYVAVVEADGVDLLKQPLVVGMGGAVPPIEITLRNDGSEVSGVVEGSPAAQGNAQAGAMSPQHDWVVLQLPLGRGTSQTSWFQTGDGRFIMPWLAPGDYLLAAFDKGEGKEPPNLEDEEFLKKLEEKGQKVHVEAGEKLTNLRIKVIQEDQEE